MMSDTRILPFFRHRSSLMLNSFPYFRFMIRGAQAESVAALLYPGTDGDEAGQEGRVSAIERGLHLP
jgi:hypothetical protein